ncbi:MAG: isoaspartyl peptidase/L-asparaginase, partial [Planctomycetes bacterium]|nr:isoaspartyl peptidase/L-asparaginase [Planctomycetota bacterium]
MNAKWIGIVGSGILVQLCFIVGAAESAEKHRDMEGNPQDSANRVTWAIVLHGGAGNVRRDLPQESVQAYRAALKDALRRGRQMLERGSTSLEAVEAVLRVMEDNPLFNAGRGAVFTHDAKHELDASIMDGRTMACGAVAGVTTVKHPITLARLVMERTPHVMLAGPGADEFAGEIGVDRVANDYFSTEHRRQQLDEALEKEGRAQGTDPLKDSAVQRAGDVYGTVGCVALDLHGNLAAGTSTGGLTNKRHGRVGDSPIIGA